MPAREPTAVSRFTDAQLEDWAAEPTDAGDVCREALALIRNALAPLEGMYPGVELIVQGGYANRTAVSAQSDVDVVARWPGVVVHGTGDEDAAAEAYRSFRDDVYDTLRTQVNQAIPLPRIACCCKVGGMSIDVVPCLPYRSGDRDDIWFWPSDHYDRPTVSWPREISRRIETRDREASGAFRPVVRALKGMRDDFWSGEDRVKSFAVESLAYTAWPHVSDAQTLRERCLAVVIAPVDLRTLTDPTGRERIADLPLFDAFEGFVDEALSRLV
ncbi:MAG TPA: hypothetical protein VFT50_11765 [Baekduia sp.]|nr:hypothetical protein [Baekduia sp.]